LASLAGYGIANNAADRTTKWWIQFVFRGAARSRVVGLSEG